MTVRTSDPGHLAMGIVDRRGLVESRHGHSPALRLGALTRGTLFLLALLLPWGDLMRVGESSAEGSERGLTTILCLGLICICIASQGIFATVLKYPAGAAYGAFLVIATIASVGSASWEVAVTRSLGYWGYFCLAMSVGSLATTRRVASRVLKVFAASGGLMSLISLLDFFEFIDLARINDRSGVRTIGGEDVRSLLGPFFSQTAVASYLSLIIPVCVAFAIKERGRRRGFWAVAAVTSTLAGVLTYSRSLLLSLAAVGFYFLLTTGRRSLLIHLISAVVALSLGVLALRAATPDFYRALVQRTATLSPNAVGDNEGDMLRVDAFEQTLSDLAVAPFGVGFTNPDVDGFGSRNVHSNLTLIFRAGGPIGFAFATIFMIPLVTAGLRKQSPEVGLPLYGALVSYAVYGIAHTTLSSAALWLFIGLSIAERHRLAEGPQAP